MDPAFEFRPTHVAPEDGLPTWSEPDLARPSVPLDPLLPVQAAERMGDWARVICSNGWSTWVDARLLVALPHRPPGTTGPPATMDDPRPLLARLERALASYRELLDQLAEGRIDQEEFRRRTSGVRLGAVLDGPEGWLLDLEQGRWFYCDAIQLQTYAVVEPVDATEPQDPP